MMIITFTDHDLSVAVSPKMTDTAARVVKVPTTLTEIETSQVSSIGCHVVDNPFYRVDFGYGSSILTATTADMMHSHGNHHVYGLNGGNPFPNVEAQEDAQEGL